MSDNYERFVQVRLSVAYFRVDQCLLAAVEQAVVPMVAFQIFSESLLAEGANHVSHLGHALLGLHRFHQTMECPFRRQSVGRQCIVRRLRDGFPEDREIFAKRFQGFGL